MLSKLPGGKKNYLSADTITDIQDSEQNAFP